MQKIINDYRIIIMLLFCIDGPFNIALNNERFLKVNKKDGYTVTATTVRAEASPFFIMKPEDRDNPHEFVIAFYGQYNSQEGAKEHKIARYLEAPVNIFGFQSGPLRVKDNVKVENSRFVLRDRLHKRLPSVEVANWVKGNEVYYIKCSRRRLAHDGYLAVKKRSTPQEANTASESSFNTACVPSTGYHDSDKVFMLFHLLPHGEDEEASQRIPSEQSKAIEAKLEELYGIPQQAEIQDLSI